MLQLHSKITKFIEFYVPHIILLGFSNDLVMNTLADLGGVRPARAPPFAWHPSF